ncbi:helix-turn-helix domain-containing protein [Microlunatus kandeliicorticis]|uniref:hypothetical protein n=1 Tax=Microlunatus kandeliicorticis TaxID=1759536 RepID=UPI0015FA4466|nr:hypothetical protein [Microlunatus kandeliicorticis]
MLQALGVSPEAEACYTALFAFRRGADLDALSSTGRCPEELERDLQELERLGLAARMGSEWQAIPLPEAVRVLKARRDAELESALQAADALHSRLLGSIGNGDGLQSVMGPSEVQGMLNRICEEAKKEICGFDKPPYVTTRSATREWLEANSAEYQALNRGVELRGVYHPGFGPERLKEMSLFISHGERARTGDVPMKLVLVDHSVALIPAPSSYVNREIRATLVRHPILVDALQSLFEAVWDRSVTIVAGQDGPRRDPRRGSLINLLMTGATDVAIAGQLGVTERSVRRWIAELMDELEVQTRLQLGAALARSEAMREDMQRLAPQEGPELR